MRIHAILPMAIDPGAEFAAWAAALVGAYTLASQVWNAIKKHRKESDEITAALDRTPEVKQQLELGNVGEAIKHLNDIIEAQARDSHRKDLRIEELSREVEELRDRAESGDDKCEATEQELRDEKARRARVEQELIQTKRGFGRTIAQLRLQIEQGNGHEEMDNDSPDLS